MDREQATRLFADFGRMAAEAAAEEERYANAKGGWLTAQQGLLQVFPDLASSPAQNGSDAPRELAKPTKKDRTRTRATAMALLNEQPNVWFSVRSIYNQLEKRGLAPDNEAALRVALRRAAEAGEIAKGSLDGRTAAYRALTDTEAAAGSTAAASGVLSPMGEGGEDSHAQLDQSDHSRNSEWPDHRDRGGDSPPLGEG